MKEPVGQSSPATSDSASHIVDVTEKYLGQAFIIAGALAGIAGHMAALNDAFVNPELLGWHRSAEALLIVLLGGIGALHGPILGAFAYTLIGEFGRSITERQRLVEGLVILAAVLLLRRGLAGLRFSP